MDAALNDFYSLINQMCVEGDLLLAEKQMKPAKQIIRKAVRAFYSAYAPIYYHRRYGLYQMARPYIKDGVFVIQMGGELSSIAHRIDNDYIDINSFQQGYHGGAMHNGVPTWRTPHPNYPYWGHEAYQTKSPEEILTEEWDFFKNTKGKLLSKMVIKQLVAKYADQVLPLLASL